MEVTQESVEELRTLFLDKLKQEYNNSTNLFHEADLNRVKNNDSWLIRFLMHHEGSVNDAFNMLWETCEWRKSMNVNEISERNICMEYLKEGSLFPYGCDKDDKILLVFRCKLHFKGQKNFDELKRCLIYWFERLERQTNGDQITIFFDMTDTGLSNMDMEFTKYLISLNKYYYPAFINYILIFEMPWVLNGNYQPINDNFPEYSINGNNFLAAFKIIKSWLPARAVQKIKFMYKNNIREYVNSNRLLVSWGGEDDYVFEFVPESRGDLSSSSTQVSAKIEETKKKTVHFALNHSSAESSPVSTSNRDVKFENEASDTIGPLIKVIHPDIVHFNWNGTEFIGSINVENISDKNVLYKIKTTSPDRFRVRPNSGILQQGVSAKITVVLQSGFPVNSVLKDKFLIMAMVSECEYATTTEIVEIWKRCDTVKLEQHRLKCSVIEPLESGNVHTNGNAAHYTSPDDLHEKVEQLRSLVYEMCASNKRLHKDLSYRQNVITIILIFLVVCVVILSIFVYKSPSFGFQPIVSQHSCSAPQINTEL